MQQTAETLSIPEYDKPRDECGVVVVVSPLGDAAETAAIAIAQLDNRGKESTGLAELYPDGQINVTKGFGTGREVFFHPHPAYAGSYIPKTRYDESFIAQAHARYSTQGNNSLDAGQPHSFEVANSLNVVRASHIHNGNLTNTAELAARLGVDLQDFHSDSDLMSYSFSVALEDQLAKNPDQKPDLKRAVLDTLPLFEGAFTGAISTNEQTVVFTDHHGLKPAVIGDLPYGGTIIASEVTALDAVGANFIREVEPGELIVMNADGSWYAEQWAEPEPQGCLLEVFYFQRPEGVQGMKALFRGIEIAAARRRAGEVLAMTTTDVTDADFVFGIPASGVPAGEGYAQGSEVPYSESAVTLKNRTRSFISPTQEQRRQAVRDKLFPDPTIIEGATAIAVDDSLVRGTTMNEFASMFYEAGAKELHVRIAFSLVSEICDLGTDLGNPLEMLANHYESLDGMAEGLGVASIEFIELKDILGKVLDHLKPGAGKHFCTGCLDGNYPSKQPTLVHSHYHAS